MDTDQKVLEWKEAKANKDFVTADALRAELRAAGVDPDKPRQRRSQDSDEWKIQEWRDAKANKDFVTADLIRSELRAKGVDPDPSSGQGGRDKGSGRSSGGRDDWGYDGHSSGGWASSVPAFIPAPSYARMPMPFMMAPASHTRRYDRAVEAELDQWEDARSQKDWDAADSIRSNLRSRGISPSKERSLHGGVQDEIERWRSAKQAKDFTRSDRIRESLRKQGVDPDSMGAMGGAIMIPVGQSGGFVPHSGGHMEKPRQAKRESARSSQSLSSMDASTIDELSQWFEAKDDKNWSIADSIRDTLRQKGIEPANCQRPGSAGLEPDMADLLTQWFEAKEQKNFGIADGIREQLRAKGVEPSQCQRPGGGGGSGDGYGKAASGRSAAKSSPYGAAGSHDSSTEAQLDAWWKAKQDKNFALSDTLRSELRAKGIEPDERRPRR
jgi:cysteinyl-tRNA synthetase